MKKLLFVCIVIVLVWLAVAPVAAQEDFERPVPPAGNKAMPWTLAGPTQDELLSQFIQASHCLAYVHGLEAVYHDYQGHREIIIFIFFDEHREYDAVVNDVIWYLIRLYPDDFGHHTAAPPLPQDRLCG